MPRQARARRLNRAEWAFVTLLLLLAAALRIVGITYGQPDPAYDPALAPHGLVNENIPIHPDEFLFVTRPLRMVLTGQLNPKFFHNPSLMNNLNFVTFWLTDAGNGLSMADRDLQTVSGRSFAPFHLYVIGRVYSTLGGLLAVAGAYALARQMGGRWAAAASGLLAALALPLVQHAHYTTTSSLAAGFTTLAVLASFTALAAQHKQAGVQWRWGLPLLLAGVAAGLAAGSRYNAAAVALVVGLTGLVLLFRARGSGHNRRALLVVLLSFAALPLVFLLTTPWVIFDTAFFLEEFRFITAQYIEGAGIEYTVSPWIGLLLEYRYLALFGLGFPAALAALWGLLLALAGRIRRAAAPGDDVRLFSAILLLYLLAYSLVVLRTARPSYTDQMLVPILPQCAVFAGLGAAWFIRRLAASGLRLSLMRVTAPLLVAALCVVPLLLSVQAVSLFAQRDTRYMMQAWIYANLPPGTRVHLLGPYNVPLDQSLYPWTQTYGDQPFLSPEAIRATGADYLLLSDALYWDLQRSVDVIPPETRQQVYDYLALLDAAFVRAASIPRPVVLGYDWMIHTGTYWHQPGLTLYCIACSAEP